MPSIYDIDFGLQAKNLDTPQRRKPKFIAFLFSLMSPLQYFRDFFYDKYVNSFAYSDYNPSIHYLFGALVIWNDKCIYQAAYIDINGDAQSFINVNPSNTTHWYKVNDTFIGTDERVRYNSQRLLFEYALNRFFMIAASPADQIYIENNFISAGSNFVMGNSGPTSSYMPLDSQYQVDYMGSDAIYNPLINDYTIYVPVSVFNSLGTTTSNRENAIKNFADLYNTIGMQYNVTTY